jgi:hypothetical protein
LISDVSKEITMRVIGGLLFLVGGIFLGVAAGGEIIEKFSIIADNQHALLGGGLVTSMIATQVLVHAR